MLACPRMAMVASSPTSTMVPKPEMEISPNESNCMATNRSSFTLMNARLVRFNEPVPLLATVRSAVAVVSVQSEPNPFIVTMPSPVKASPRMALFVLVSAVPPAMFIVPTSTLPIRSGPATFPPTAGGTGATSPALEITACAGVAQMNAAHAATTNANARMPIPRTLPDRANLDRIARTSRCRKGENDSYRVAHHCAGNPQSCLRIGCRVKQISVVITLRVMIVRRSLHAEREDYTSVAISLREIRRRILTNWPAKRTIDETSAVAGSGTGASVLAVAETTVAPKCVRQTLKSAASI